jgi:hypothetical protein
MRFARDMPAGRDMPVGHDMPFGREHTAKLQFSFHLCKKRTPLFTPRKKISNLTKLEKFAFPT